MAGLAGLVILIVFFATRRAHSRLGAWSPCSGIYAETFAVWLGLYFVLSFLGSLLPGNGPRLLLGGAVSLLSLSALAWPVVRGVPWRQVREEIGLTLARKR